MRAPALTPARRREFRAGARLVGPTLLGTFFWGVVTGVALIDGGLSVMQAVGMTLLVFSGTAQLATLPLLASGASVLLIWLTAFLANLRFVVYSASVAADFRRVPQPLRMVLGYVTTDSGLAAYLIARRSRESGSRLARFIGANGTVWLSWQLGSLAGIALAGALPAGAQLSFIGVLAILALIGPMLVTKPSLAAAAAAAGVALLGLHWPYRLGMFAAIVAGVAAALWVDRRQQAARR